MLLIEPPASSLLLEARSPAYAAPPPDRLGVEYMPPDILAACAAQMQGGFGARPLRIWLLRDVFVAMEGLVFDHQGRVFAPSVTQHHHTEIEWAAGQVDAAIRGADTERHTLPLVLGKKRGVSNYGHWLLEMLPSLHFARQRIGSDALGVLVHDVTEPQLGGVMLQSLRRIGVADRLVRVSGMAPVRVDRLLLVEGLTAHGMYMSPLVTPAMSALADGITGEGHERVFIRRGTDMRRDFADPSRIEMLARRAGYHVMDTDGLTLEQQIAQVRNAKVVAGAMGAAMTNLVFAAAGAEIRVFAGGAMPDTFFWFAATVTGRRFQELRCRQAEEVRGLPYDRALLVSDETVDAFLAA